MDNLFQHELSEDEQHPPREQLLLYVDGELTPKDAVQLQSHLEACWSCRARTGKLEEAIAEIIEFDDAALAPNLTPPPRGWQSFDGLLGSLAAESGKRSLLSRLRGFLGGLLPSAQQFSVHLSLQPQLAGRLAAALLVALVITALIIQSNRVTMVSAGELLQRATGAYTQELQAVPQPVVYRKLRVKRKAVASASEAATLETWSDPTNARFRQWADHWSPILVELENTLRANRLDARQPLSAAGYRAWREAIGQKDEQVVKTSLADGAEALQLRTVVKGQVNPGAIAEASLLVRVKDWHPVAQQWRVRTDDGDREYELTELAFQVVSLNVVGASIFAEPLAAASPPPALSASPMPSSLATVTASATPAGLAAAELEVEVLALLNQAGADLDEQASVMRTPAGGLRVAGVVETEQRKTEILRALAPVINHPALRIEIETVTEALKHQAQPSPSAVTVERVEVAQGAIPAEPELRRHFSQRGGSTEEEIGRFAARMVNGSSQAMSHLGALRRLMRQFSPAELRTFSQEARAKWLAIIRAHAVAFTRETEKLRGELQPIFFPVPPANPAPEEIEISSNDDLARAVERLSELGAANDRVIRAAFTTAPDGAAVSAIKTPQFWRSLRSAEQLAAKIVKHQ